MNPKQELIFDFDHAVGTEDRFAIRRFVNAFVSAVNNQGKDDVSRFLSKSITAEGFGEFPLQQLELINLYYKKFFGRRHSYIHFPQVRLTTQKSFFLLSGSYEEYQEGILSAAGTIDLWIVKQDEQYLIEKIIFYPRMRAVESE
ncbi:MAG TPA: hypothetical protein PKD79_04260 [Candidatus Doudnabacteria bacterium]|nr:hypothetical protein [Candidatus Doudnabacteria bacterium]